MLHIANRCFWMLPFATLSDPDCSNKAKFLADMRVKFLMELEGEHSAPAHYEIPSDGINWWQCGKPGSTPTRTVIVAVAKLVVQKMADYQGRPRGQ